MGEGPKTIAVVPFVNISSDPEQEYFVDGLSEELLNSLTFYIWFPQMRQARQLPRFKEFIREIGLVDYWNKFGWPDFCRPVGDDDFECD